MELEKACAELLSDSAQREALSQNAKKAVRANLGAVERTVEMIIHGIKDRGVYLAPHPKPELSEPART